MNRNSVAVQLAGGITGDFGAPGSLVDCINFYCRPLGGYARFPGFERFDGRPRPSDAVGLEIESRRAEIHGVPGVGSVLGLVKYAGAIYAVRGQTLCKSTDSGWVGVFSNLPLGGRWNARSVRFPSGEHLVLVDGKSGAFRFDGSTFASIALPASCGSGAPQFAVEFGGFLLLAWADGRILHSAPGSPFDFGFDGGAGLLKVDGNILDLVAHRGALFAFTDLGVVAFTRDGETPTDWPRQMLIEHVSPKLVAVAGGTLFAVDATGMASFESMQQVGRFAFPAMAQRLGWIASCLVSAGLMLVDASRQTALIFSHGRTLAVTFNASELVGFGDCVTPDNVTCGCCSDDGRLFVGTVSGMVYELMRGRSADGEPLRSLLHLSSTDLGAPGVKKLFHRTEVRGSASGDESFTIQLSPIFDFKKSASSLSKAMLAPHEIDKIRLDEDYIDPPPMPFTAANQRSNEAEWLGLLLEHNGCDLDDLLIHSLNIQFTPRAQDR